MSETDEGRGSERGEKDQKDASDLADDGLGATAGGEPNTMEPEEVPETAPDGD